MAKVVKVTISLPADTFRAVERIRRARGQPRSAVVGDALAAWLRAVERGRKVRAYVDAYRASPPDEEERATQEAWAAAETWSRERW